MTGKLPKETLTRARDVSQSLFGAKHRLPMALVVGAAGDEELYAAVLAPRVQTTEAQAGTELRVLANAGLLVELAPRQPAQRGRPPRLYARVDSDFWPLAEALVAKPPVKPTR